MSFGVGLGDIVLVAQTIVNTVQAIRNVPTELDDLAVRVESIEAVLTAFDRAAPGTKLGANDEVPKIPRTARLLKQKVKDVLLEMEVIVKTYQESNLLQRIKFLARTKGDLPGLELKLSQRTDALTTWLTIQNFGKTDKLQDLLEKDDNAFSEKDIEKRFTDAGLSNVDASTLVATINSRRNDITHAKANGLKSAESSAQVTGTGSGWIMVVDQGNGALSVIGQSYLELVRVWTVNTSGRWLFKRVVSAGTHISTECNKPQLDKLQVTARTGGDTAEGAAIDAVVRGTPHNSEEKTAIIARMRRHRKRGIDEWHFRHYEYMLCFDQPSFNILLALKETCKKKHANNPAYADLAKVRLLGELSIRNPVGSVCEEEVEKQVENVKMCIKGFLREEMHWTAPTQGIRDGPYRTVQIVLPTLKVMPMLGGLLDEIQKKTGCRIWVTYYQTDEKKTSDCYGEERNSQCGNIPLAGRLRSWQNYLDATTLLSLIYKGDIKRNIRGREYVIGWAVGELGWLL